MTPNKAGELVTLLNGVLELETPDDLTTMCEIMKIHGSELFEWIEEYMIDHEDNGYHKINRKAFVEGIRYFIFYKLAGEEHGKTRITSDMYRRLVSIEVDMSRDAWGATLDQGDASEDEAKAFSDMIRHGITEEKIERLQAMDYIIEE
jgi:hypothetical protein